VEEIEKTHVVGENILARFRKLPSSSSSARLRTVSSFILGENETLSFRESVAKGLVVFSSEGSQEMESAGALSW
jgi:hypothetical protein